MIAIDRYYLNKYGFTLKLEGECDVVAISIQFSVDAM